MRRIPFVSSKSNYSRYFSTAKEPFEYDIGIVGGGIVGIATGRELLIRHPKLRIKIVEKESDLARHQSSHNSGVIHSGLYYAPGSMRAKLCVEGSKRLYQYCDQFKVPYERCGKLIVAIQDSELPGLEKLYKRGLENGVEDLKILDGQEMKRYEPHITGIRAIYVPSTGIIDFEKVALSYAENFKAMGGQIETDFQVSDIIRFGKNGIGEPGVKIVSPSGKTLTARYMIACAGLYSDRIAKITGGSQFPSITPFRGEWRKLKKEHTGLVKGLIYPVPDPRYPFLGVHFTKKLNGDVWMGPNAVLATSREGYRISDFNLGDFKEALSNRALQKLALKNISTGMGEIYRSLFLSPYVRMLKEYIPEIKEEFIEKGKTSGVRAQALDEKGNLVEDFVFDFSKDWRSVLHVRNAPSPAATSSLAIARVVTDMAEANFQLLTQKELRIEQ